MWTAINTNKTNQPTNQHLQNVSNFMKNDWKLADECELFPTDIIDATAQFFVNLSFKIYGYSQSTKWRHCVQTNCTTRFFPWKCHSTSQFAQFFLQKFPILIGERKIIVFQYQEKYIYYLPRAEKQISIQIGGGAPDSIKSESIKR